MYKWYIIFLLLSIVLSSCNLLKKTNTDFKLPNNISLSEKEIIKKVNSQNIAPEWTSLNSKIKIKKDDEDTRINAQFRIKKDSVIWISVKASLGIEIFRTMITLDSIYYMSRINKNYFIKHISHIEEVLKTDISFIKLQEILFASPSITHLNSEKENYEILKDIFKIYKIDLKETEDKKVSILYSDYKVYSELGELYFPNKIFIDIESEENFKLEINHTKIEFNKDSKLSFKIPKSYVTIN